MMQFLLRAENLRAYYYMSREKVAKAVDNVSLEVYPGEILGIVGESGCGKSTLANVLMINIRPPLRLTMGKIILEKYELTKMKRDEVKKKIWGRLISMVPQSALNALNPTIKVKDFIKDVLKARTNMSEKEIVEVTKKRFTEIGLPTEALEVYPFELSGGMRQRVTIAVATLLDPLLLIADEPTSALDVSTQKSVLKMMVDLKKRGIIKSIIFITHDIATLRQIANRVVVMYAGKVVEVGPIEEIINSPLHPYTIALIRSVVTPEPEVRKRKLFYIPGRPPDLFNPPKGCRFRERCPQAMEICAKKEPELIEVKKGHFVACHLYSNR